MKHKLILLYLCVAAVLAGCYEDKGNYSYTDIPKYVIDESSFGGGSTLSLAQGDTLTLSPVILSEQGDTLRDIANVEYSWSIDYAQVVSRERDLTYVCDSLMSNALLVFDIHDLVNDLHYAQTVYVSVREKYSGAGFYILGEKDGHTCLSAILSSSFLGDKVDIANSTIRTVVGVYHAENDEYLPDDPIRLHEHNWYGGGPQVMVITPTELVDVESSTFVKDMTGSEMIDGGWPAGMRAANVMYMGWTDVLEDEEGQIYTRIKSTKELPNSEYFYPVPCKCEGEDEPLTDTHIIVSKLGGNFCLLHDDKHKRLLHVSDIKSDSKGECTLGRISALRHFEGPAGFVPLDNYEGYNLVHCGYHDQYQYGGTGYSYVFIFEKDGQYTVQTCRIWQDNYNSSTLMVDNMAVLSASEDGSHVNLIDDIMRADSYVYTLPYTTQASNPGAYTFIASGNDLYMLDRTAKSVKKYLSFDAPVTAMCGEWFNSNYMGLGLENGKFYLLPMQNAKNLDDSAKILWESPDDFGRIVSVRTKEANGWGVDQF